MEHPRTMKERQVLEEPSRSVGEPSQLSLEGAPERFEHGIRSLPHGALAIPLAGEVAT